VKALVAPLYTESRSTLTGVFHLSPVPRPGGGDSGSRHVATKRGTRTLGYFLSYAHGSETDDKLVAQFHEDLTHEMALHSGWSDREIGFCDTGLRIGDPWSPALVKALCTCQVFLALCTERYFERPACGKEWTIFSRRLAATPSRAGDRPGSLMPLRWMPVAMPQVAAGFQYKDSDLGDVYHKHGLRDLVRMQKYQDEYRGFVTALARRIVTLDRRYKIRPEPSRPAFDDVEPAFPREDGNGSPPRAPEDPPPTRRTYRSPVDEDDNMPRFDWRPPDQTGGDPR
jgi:hypothetical protein